MAFRIEAHVRIGSLPSILTYPPYTRLDRNRGHGSRRIGRDDLSARQGNLDVIGSAFFRSYQIAGRQLITLRDAAIYSTALPKTEQDAPQSAAEFLLVIAERGGDTMMVRIAMMKALIRHEADGGLTPRRISGPSAGGS